MTNNAINKQRDYTGIDLFRFIAAFAVVGLHVNYADLNNNLVLALRMFGRFAVPFFFLVSGFFWNVNSTEALWKQLKKLGSIILIANLVYLLFHWIDNGFPGKQLLNLSTYITGLSGHLWFLNAMVLGVVFMYYIGFKINRKVMWVIALGIYLVFVVCFTYNTMHNRLAMELGRALLSIPFLFAGSVIRQYVIQIREAKKRYLLLLMLGGLFAQLLEAVIMYKWKGVSPHGIEFNMGTLIYATGMFLLSLIIVAPGKISGWGRDHSLFIYLYHPLSIVLFTAIVTMCVSGPLQHYCFWLSLPIVFAITMVASLLLARFLPSLFGWLNGRFSSVRK